MRRAMTKACIFLLFSQKTNYTNEPTPPLPLVNAPRHPRPSNLIIHPPSLVPRQIPRLLFLLLRLQNLVHLPLSALHLFTNEHLGGPAPGHPVRRHVRQLAVPGLQLGLGQLLRAVDIWPERLPKEEVLELFPKGASSGNGSVEADSCCCTLLASLLIFCLRQRKGELYTHKPKQSCAPQPSSSAKPYPPPGKPPAQPYT